MALVTSGWQNLLNEPMKEIFIDEYIQIPSKIDLIAGMDTTEKYQEEYLSIAGLGNFEKGIGPVHRLTASEAYTKTIVPDRWTAAIDVQYELYKTDQTGKIKQLVQSLAMSAKRTREEDFWGNVFGHAFDTTKTTPDGLSLCSTAHTSPVSATTQGNSGTSALSYASYVATRALMRRFKDWNDKAITVVPDTIIVPVELEEQALVLAHSALKSGTANNDTNPINKNYGPAWGLNVIVCDYLTDANNWFLIDSKMAKKQLKYLVGEKLRLFNDSTTEMVLTFGGYMRYAFESLDWRFIYGHNVA
jgi:phage major head subunit gpT-like protein